jgi:hypothetical protein
MGRAQVFADLAGAVVTAQGGEQCGNPLGYYHGTSHGGALSAGDMESHAEVSMSLYDAWRIEVDRDVVTERWNCYA